MVPRDVLAAGAVVVREKGRQVLLVHRPKYDDWSFPKGKLDPGEHVTTAAVREVLEESGVHVRLGVPLPHQRYGVGNGRMKVVHYWIGHVLDDGGDAYEPNDEVDELRWLGWDEAEALLSYRRDRVILAAAQAHARRTTALVVLRHAKAVARKDWSGLDRARPLTEVGEQQAADLTALLAAYGVGAVHTSSSTRCLATVLPYAQAAGLDLHAHEVLTEEGHDATAAAELVAGLRAGRQGAVVCSHRPQLPGLLEAAGIPLFGLSPGELVVVHVRRGEVLACERHEPGETQPGT
jgi:8-oxo-dGTP diphosphatase